MATLLSQFDCVYLIPGNREGAENRMSKLDLIARHFQELTFDLVAVSELQSVGVSIDRETQQHKSETECAKSGIGFTPSTWELVN